METIIIIFVMIALIFIVKVKHFNNFNPILIFNALWLCVIVGSLFAPLLGLEEPSSEARRIIYLGILGVNIGLVFGERYGFIIGNRYKKRNNVHYIVDMKIIRIFTVIVLLSVLWTSVSNIGKLLSGSSFFDIREEYYDINSGSLFSYYWTNFVILPLQYIVIIGAIQSFFSKKREMFIVISAGLIVLLQVLQSSGRYIMLNAIVIFISITAMNGTFGRLSKKFKRRMFGLISILAIGIIYVTSVRSLDAYSDFSWYEKLFYNGYVYFVGGMTYCSKMIEKYPNAVGSTMGVNMFAGFLIPIFSILTFLNILPYPEMLNIIGTQTTESILIGKGMSFNAFTTIFYHYYLDFGLNGVLIESIILGYLTIRIYKNAIRKGDWLSLAYYALISIVIINSSEKNFFYSTGIALAFIFARIACKKRIINTN